SNSNLAYLVNGLFTNTLKFIEARLQLPNAGRVSSAQGFTPANSKLLSSLNKCQESILSLNNIPGSAIFQLFFAKTLNKSLAFTFLIISSPVASTLKYNS